MQLSHKRSEGYGDNEIGGTSVPHLNGPLSSVHFGCGGEANPEDRRYPIGNSLNDISRFPQTLSRHIKMPTYKGSCHCGRAQFEVDIADLKQVRVCDCSICARRGALNVRVEDKDIKLISKLEDLTLYQFHTKTAKDYFCPVCGILPFRRPRSAPELWTVNVRCLEGVDLEQLETIKVYGSKLS